MLAKQHMHIYASLSIERVGVMVLPRSSLFRWGAANNGALAAPLWTCAVFVVVPMLVVDGHFNIFQRESIK